MKSQVFAVLFVLSACVPVGAPEPGEVPDSTPDAAVASPDAGQVAPAPDATVPDPMVDAGDKRPDAGTQTPPDAGFEVPPVPELGLPATRTFTVVGTRSDGLSTPRDLDFHPDRPNELWVVNRATDGTVTYFDPGTPNQRADSRVDAYANHFMEEVSSIAMGARNTFGTCQESDNRYNNSSPPNGFMGPSLWPADLSIYARVNQRNGLLGSHLDMLHESPFCMGMAHERDNVFWVFDGNYGMVVRYDFQQDHGPGYDDHADGIIRRYVEARVTRVPGVPSHLALDEAKRWLYVADTGGSRILRLDVTTGRVAGPVPSSANNQQEPLVEYTRVEGVTVETFVGSGLMRPSGIDVHSGRVFVSDNATSEIVVFDESGTELARVVTPARGLMGIKRGPDGKIWYVDATANEVVRVDPE